MISNIQRGDIVKCLRCGNEIEVGDGTFILTPDSELIKCSVCGYAADVQFYHLFGECVEKDKSIIERMPGENTPKETRREAHESINKEKRNRQIIDCLSAYGPMTAKEIAVNLYDRGIIPSSERNYTAPRLTEMSQRGMVEPIGRKKCKYTGKTVAVYRLI